MKTLMLRIYFSWNLKSRLSANLVSTGFTAVFFWCHQAANIIQRYVSWLWFEVNMICLQSAIYTV